MKFSGCIRCESEEHIQMYHHKGPDKPIGSRLYTRITTFPRIGGSGNVPVCSRCYKLFTRWKITRISMFLLLFFQIIVYGYYLLFELVMLQFRILDVEGWKPPPLTTTEVILLILGGILLFILSYIHYFIHKKSNSNPSKFINIREYIIKVKPLNADWWTRIEDWEIIF